MELYGGSFRRSARAKDLRLAARQDRAKANKKAGIEFETGLDELKRVSYSSSIWLYIRLSWIS